MEVEAFTIAKPALLFFIYDSLTHYSKILLQFLFYGQIILINGEKKQILISAEMPHLLV